MHAMIDADDETTLQNAVGHTVLMYFTFWISHDGQSNPFSTLTNTYSWRR